MSRKLNKRIHEESADAKLIMAIDSTLIEIKQALIEFHNHDVEIAKLGEETRNLIGELQRELKLKAA